MKMSRDVIENQKQIARIEYEDVKEPDVWIAILAKRLGKIAEESIFKNSSSYMSELAQMISCCEMAIEDFEELHSDVIDYEQIF